ncbi:MAG: hypothetical protein ACK4M7_01735 [Burkholderiales bacterium]
MKKLREILRLHYEAKRVFKPALLLNKCLDVYCILCRIFKIYVLQPLMGTDYMNNHIDENTHGQ